WIRVTQTAPSEALNGCDDPILTSRERKLKFSVKRRNTVHRDPRNLRNFANGNIAKTSVGGRSPLYRAIREPSSAAGLFALRLRWRRFLPARLCLFFQVG